MRRTRQIFFAVGLFCLAQGPAWLDSLDEWTPRASGFALNLAADAHGADKFAAVGQSGVGSMQSASVVEQESHHIYEREGVG